MLFNKIQQCLSLEQHPLFAKLLAIVNYLLSTNIGEEKALNQCNANKARDAYNTVMKIPECYIAKQCR